MTIETYNKATKILEEIKKLELSIKAYNKVLNSENEFKNINDEIRFIIANKFDEKFKGKIVTNNKKIGVVAGINDIGVNDDEIKIIINFNNGSNVDFLKNWKLI